MSPLVRVAELLGVSRRLSALQTSTKPPALFTLTSTRKPLNAIGVTPRDMMAIFQAMKQAGALQAELILR